MPAIRVLLIEDDFASGDLLQAVMQPTYEVLRASNGLEGMRLALNGEPDLIVTDIMMPVMDGHEFVKRLRRFEGYENMPVIFISSLSSSQDVKRGYDLGAALYLNKPLEPKRFRRNLDLFVEDRALTGRPKSRTPEEAMASLAGGAQGMQGRAGEDTTSRRMREETTSRRTAAPQPPAAAPRPAAAPNPESTASRAAAPRPSGTDSQSRRPTIPLNRQAVMQAQSSNEPVQPDRLRLMIIEHEPESLKAMTQGLESEYEVVAAHDGIEAIERMIRYHPDLFIIDAQIPKMAANHLIAMIRKDHHFIVSPIIYLSSKLDPHTTYQLERMGIKDFLPKPATLAMIKTVLKKTIQERGVTIRRGRLPWEQVRMELGIAEGFRSAVFNPFMKSASSIVAEGEGETTASKKLHVHKKDDPEDAWRD